MMRQNSSSPVFEKMILFKLPRLSMYLYRHMTPQYSPFCDNDYNNDDDGDGKQSLANDVQEPKSSLLFYLNDIKTMIDTYSEEWDFYKRLTNPYEYIHGAIPIAVSTYDGEHARVRTSRASVAKYRPLSRSFFKMIEILYEFGLGVVARPGQEDRIKAPIKSFHLAEGPGGFIEALALMRKNPSDTYYGMTLAHKEECSSHMEMDPPGWRKTKHFLRNHPNVVIEHGVDKTGNILSLVNFIDITTKYANSMDLITADGGFDFTRDFNQQEHNASVLIFAQIAYAICLQKHNGCFVLKVFDVFSELSVQMLALLSSVYKEVYVTKPHTSRMANSEKYIVCKGFLFGHDRTTHAENDIALCMHACFGQCIQNDFYNKKQFFPSIMVPMIFRNRLQEVYSILGHQQIESIHETIQLIKKPNGFEKKAYIQGLIRRHVQCAIDWCRYHHMNTTFSN